MFPSMNGAGTDAKGIVARMGDMMNNLRVKLSALMRDGPPATCEDHINLAVADFGTASIATSAASGAGSFSDDKAVLLRCGTLMDVNVVPSGSVPRLPKPATAAPSTRLWPTSMVT